MHIVLASILMLLTVSSASAQKETVGPCATDWLSKASSGPTVGDAKSELGRPNFLVVHQATDTRIDVEECSDSSVLANSLGVVAILQDKDDFNMNQNKVVIYPTKHDRQRSVLVQLKKEDKKKVCGFEKFREQFNMAYCSGVIIAPKIVLTAGHCVERYSDRLRRPAADLRFVLDMKNMKAEAPPMAYEEKDARVRRVVKMAAFKSDKGEDLGLLQLDRPVENIRVIKIRRGGGVLNAGEKVYALGHPNGLPMKLAPNGEIKTNITSDYYFESDLPLFHGNSGGPIFNVKTHELEGLVIAGEADWFYYKGGDREKAEDQDCATSFCKLADPAIQKCEQFEKAARISSVPRWLFDLGEQWGGDSIRLEEEPKPRDRGKQSERP